MLAKRWLRLWGEAPGIQAWQQDVPKQWEVLQCDDADRLIARFQENLQRRASRSYKDMGNRHFKPGTTEGDFEMAAIADAFTAVPTGGASWGAEAATLDLKFTRMREWPLEPDTGELLPDDPYLAGIEIEQKQVVSDADLARDMARWKRAGQTWESAFLKPAQKKIQNYFTKNDAAARKAHRAAVERRVEGARNNSDRRAKYDRVDGISIQQSELRPAARGRIWSWESGTCQEVGTVSIANRVGFNAQNVKAAAELVGFRDRRVLQMITDTGVTHGTEGFPFACHLYPNHQGAARHLDEVSTMIKEKVAERHFAAVPGAADTDKAKHVCMSRPLTLPCMQVPMNGTEQKLKAAEFFLQESGMDYKPNVRGTMNGSSPHNGQSPNDQCELLERLNLPWVTVTHVVDTVSVLSTVGSPMSMFKVDMRRAYQQLLMQVSQTWRQHLHWCWDDNDGVHCGFMKDMRMQWGAKASGSIYHRGITTLIVKYVTARLLSEWVPNIACPTARKWAADRVAAGLTGVQAMPASVDGFLDDFFFFVCGSEEDRRLAHNTIMEAFRFLGFTISGSKLKEEGSLSQLGEILGHGFDLKKMERFVTAHKQARIRKIITELLRTDVWDRKEIESLVGVIQSVKHDVPRRWRLGELCALVCADGVPGKR
jgi:hypothetical protein